MDKRAFQINVSGAETFRRSTKFNERAFWDGYLRGVYRHYHGALFGTDDEHTLWLGLLANKTRDIRRNYRGLGYQCGLNGTNVTDALKHFEKTDTRTLVMAAFKQAYPETNDWCDFNKEC